MNNAKLVGTRFCPVCGGSEREASNGMSSRTGFQYLRHAAAPLGVSVEDLVRRAKVYKCKSCGSFFCDPWLGPELASSLFCAGAPDHMVGWADFEHWLHRRRNLNIFQVRNQRLYAVLAGRLGAVSSYAELGCPFQGFLLQLKGYETTPRERIRLFAKALNREPDVRWTKIARIYNAALRWCGRLVVISFRIQTVLASLAAHRKIPDKQGKIAARQDNHEEVPVSSLPKSRYLLTQDSAMGWGSNCVRFGASCRYFAHTVLGADVIPIGETHQNGFPKLDLVGIFNSLDHTTAPLEVIRRSLELAKHVLIVTHHASHAGKQHLFAFGDNFSTWLNRVLEGISVEDLRREVDVEGHGDYSYILLSRKADTR